MASNVTVKVDINERNLQRAINYAPGTGSAISREVRKIANNANTLSSGFKTVVWYDAKEKKKKGGTPAKYKTGVKIGKKGYVGIVYTANYAAQKENHLHNTLLKAKR